MKTPEKDLQEQKKKVGDFSKELKEFSDEELDNVAGGAADDRPYWIPDPRQGHMGV